MNMHMEKHVGVVDMSIDTVMEKNMSINMKNHVERAVDVVDILVVV